MTTLCFRTVHRTGADGTTDHPQTLELTVTARDLHKLWFAAGIVAGGLVSAVTAWWVG